MAAAYWTRGVDELKGSGAIIGKCLMIFVCETNSELSVTHSYTKC